MGNRGFFFFEVPMNLLERPVIKKLNAVLVNQIAAGEVVERPSSVVKELVENSLDAGAKKITVKIRQGGKTLIQVVDDGCGMTEEDLNLAVQRHATSKLPNDNIFDIKSFGFRGEALPSIASVSKVTLESLPRSQGSEARLIEIEGGEIKDKTFSSMKNCGTKITIKDLFFATPARLKFLKTEQFENQACIDQLKKIALAYPDVGFSLYCDDKLAFEYMPVETIQERCQQILGAKTFDNLRFFEINKNGMRVWGLLSLPTFHKSQNTEQYFFINKRPVKDKLFQVSLRIAYQDFLEKNRHPVAILFLEMDPRDIDVNVHPAKTEIRFRDEYQLKQFMIGSLKASLSMHTHESASSIATDTLMKMRPVITDSDSIGNHGNQWKHSSLKQASFSAPSQRTWGPQEPQFTDRTSSVLNHGENYSVPRERGEERLSVLGQHHNNFEKQSNGIVQFNETYLENGEKPLGCALGQINKSYIVSQTDDHFFIIDQHAAHERLNYEYIKSKYVHNGLAKQLLLIPIMKTLDENHCAMLRNFESVFLRLGFDVHFYGSQIVFKSIPDLLKNEDYETIIDEMIEEIKGQDFSNIVTSSEEKIFEMLATHACHTSIRAGDKLSVLEMNQLLRQIEGTPHYAQCNHGRPTYIKLSLKDIEKLFQRT